MHVAGRAELYELEGRARPAGDDDRARRRSGDHLVALERLKRRLAAEGLFADRAQAPSAARAARGRRPDRRGRGRARRPRRDDRRRFPATKVVVCETRVQGRGAPAAIVAALCARSPAHPEVDVVVLARGGGSFEDLLPFSDEAVVRAVAACPVPVVSAVGHEQDTPLCDLAADVRAATPTAAAALVVPDRAGAPRPRSSRADGGSSSRSQRSLERDAHAAGRVRRTAARSARASCSNAGARRSTTPVRGCRRSLRSRPSNAATRSSARTARLLRDAAASTPGERLEIELASGAARRARRGGAGMTRLDAPAARAPRSLLTGERSALLSGAQQANGTGPEGAVWVIRPEGTVPGAAAGWRRSRAPPGVRRPPAEERGALVRGAPARARGRRHHGSSAAMSRRRRDRALPARARSSTARASIGSRPPSSGSRS